MTRGKGFYIVAELPIHPIGEGTSVSRYVRAAVAELRKHGPEVLGDPHGDGD